MKSVSLDKTKKQGIIPLLFYIFVFGENVGFSDVSAQIFQIIFSFYYVHYDIL